jgi:hypothetical protein
LNRRQQAAEIEDAGSQVLYEIDRGLAVCVALVAASWRCSA